MTFKKIHVFRITNDLFYETFPNLTKLAENFVLLVSTYVAITVLHLLQLTPEFHTEHEGWAETQQLFFKYCFVEVIKVAKFKMHEKS